ncbi:CapA family protein [Cohnella caldifontis]|uniref:CapA family protein n=1 Tax=Cohnella caldifontis TaxID=3027471 RepID=UPI0023EB9DBB|nr:CapA family protein [Cohnella sp. YIM B05605]
MPEPIVFYGVGDVGPERDDPDSIFARVAPVFRGADVTFCQLEPVLSRRGAQLPQVRMACRGEPEVAGAIRRAGFQVVSFATNHCMDLGREAFQDTLDVLRGQNLAVIGAGRNIEEARQPAIVECKGTKIAFLAYNTILPQSFWAEADRPGCAPLRAHTVYEQIEHDQPGTPCRIHTFAHRADLQAMVRDVRLAKSRADLVFVSMHGGIHFVPAVLADYQREMAHAAIDAGADLILGHHAHILKGVEVYKGKAVFYSLGNFAMELPRDFRSEGMKSGQFKEIQGLNPDWKPERAAWPPDSYKSMTVKCAIENGRITRVSYLPTHIDLDNVPEIVAADHPRFAEIVRYVREISDSQGLKARFTVLGNEVVVEPAAPEEE